MMEIGVLYHSDLEPVDAVRQIIDEYREKYGKPPQVLEVNLLLKDIELPPEMRLVIRAQRYIHHPKIYWIGEE